MSSDKMGGESWSRSVEVLRCSAPRHQCYDRVVHIGKGRKQVERDPGETLVMLAIGSLRRCPHDPHDGRPRYYRGAGMSAYLTRTQCIELAARLLEATNGEEE